MKIFGKGKDVLFAVVMLFQSGCAATPDPIELLAAKLSASYGLWQNGFDTELKLPSTASAEEVASQVMKGSYVIRKVREVQI